MEHSSPLGDAYHKKSPPGTALNKNPLRSSLSEGHSKGATMSIVARRARVANWIVEIASGATHKAIGERYNVSTQLIQKELRWAEREGFFDKAEDAILHRLVPLSIDVFEKALKKALETGEFEAADRVLTKLVKFFDKGPRDRDTAVSAPGGINLNEAEEISWERFIARRAASQQPESQHEQSTATAQSASGARDGGAPDAPLTIDAEIIREGRESDGVSGEDSRDLERHAADVAPDGAPARAQE